MYDVVYVYEYVYEYVYTHIFVDKVSPVEYTRNTKGATGRRSDPEWMNYKK